MSEALIGWGTQLWMKDDMGVWTQLAEVTEAGLPDPQVDEVEATHFLSPDRSKEYIAGLKENGEIAFSINWVPGSDTHDLITGALQSVRALRVIVPTSEDEDGWVFEFDGLVKGFGKTIPVGDRMTATMTVRVSGAVSEYSAS